MITSHQKNAFPNLVWHHSIVLFCFFRGSLILWMYLWMLREQYLAWLQGRIFFTIYLNDLKSSTNSTKLMVLSDIMRFWKPLKQPLPRPCHDLLLHVLQPTKKRWNISAWVKGNCFTSPGHCFSHTLAEPWLFLRGSERTAYGTGWVQPCWKKGKRRMERLAFQGF